ncbi:MAG TPA: class I SAM-dependent methyltransferase [Verrucomicrobiae bacterium]|nr:class I SAM-dependent methyltransferase [Verrucomicrobiae bacterium]
MTHPKPDYGLDAPGLVRGFLLGGAAMMAGGYLLSRWGFTAQRVAFRAVPISTGMALFWTGLALFLESFLLMASSYYGKFRARDRLLDGLRLTGHEAALDVGCGHGLLLIGAAKRLPNGRVTGVDLWSQVDQGSNSKEATLRNAALEGVADRVEVQTGDMRKMPFADASFDVVMANLAIHNVPSREGRRQAIAEIARVLKPGGRVALMDFKCVGDYAADLRAFGLPGARVSGPIFWIFPPVRIASGEKPGAAG